MQFKFQYSNILQYSNIRYYYYYYYQTHTRTFLPFRSTSTAKGMFPINFVSAKAETTIPYSPVVSPRFCTTKGKAGVVTPTLRPIMTMLRVSGHRRCLSREVASVVSLSTNCDSVNDNSDCDDDGFDSFSFAFSFSFAIAMALLLFGVK